MMRAIFPPGSDRTTVRRRRRALSRGYRAANFTRAARQSFAEHLIATKALRCTATAWMLIVAQCSAIPRQDGLGPVPLPDRPGHGAGAREGRTLPPSLQPGGASRLARPLVKLRRSRSLVELFDLKRVHWSFGDKVSKLGRQPLNIIKHSNKAILNNTKLY